jgi:2-oxoglutarate ferredoxin oxidoreductase subunit beta
MMPEDYNTKQFPNWCPGCGDLSIWASLKSALMKLNLTGDKVLVTYGIGCHGHMVNFLKVNGFEGLHGRPVPVAEGVKLANHKLPVIAVSGDGDAYGEGLTHFLNAARGNHNLTYIVHNNQVYGLTTGQTSPTSMKGFKSKSTPEGVIDEPVNPLTLAISAGATFVSRGFAGDIPFTTELIMQAINHNGFALVDIFQPCVTFNKINTYQWFREHIYKLQDHNTADKIAAMKKAMETEKLPIGIFYKENKPAYEDQVSEIKQLPLIKQSLKVDTKQLMEEFL